MEQGSVPMLCGVDSLRKEAEERIRVVRLQHKRDLFYKREKYEMTKRDEVVIEVSFALLLGVHGFEGLGFAIMHQNNTIDSVSKTHFAQSSKHKQSFTYVQFAKKFYYVYMQSTI